VREECDRPAPEAFQPRLSVWGHTWRLVVTLAISSANWLPVVEHQSEEQFVLDLGLGLASYVLVFGFRRRWPVPVALLACLAGAGSSVASGPGVLATVSVATRRRWREVALVGSVGFACAQFFATWQPGSGDDSFWLLLTVNAVATAAMLAWGMYIGSRR
jgi:hypothetical protein